MFCLLGNHKAKILTWSGKLAENLQVKNANARSTTTYFGDRHVPLLHELDQALALATCPEAVISSTRPTSAAASKGSLR